MISSLMAPILAAFVLYSPVQRVQPDVKLSPVQTECITQAVYFESRSERTIGSAAVAYVILNRIVMEHKTACEIVHEKGQFSYYRPNKRLAVQEFKAWQHSADVAIGTQLGIIKNPIGNATLYNTVPVRLKHVVFVRKIHHEYFYQFRSTMHLAPLVKIPEIPYTAASLGLQDLTSAESPYSYTTVVKSSHKFSYEKRLHHTRRYVKYNRTNSHYRFFKKSQVEYCRRQNHKVVNQTEG